MLDNLSVKNVKGIHIREMGPRFNYDDSLLEEKNKHGGFSCKRHVELSD